MTKKTEETTTTEEAPTTTVEHSVEQKTEGTPTTVEALPTEQEKAVDEIFNDQFQNEDSQGRDQEVNEDSQGEQTITNQKAQKEEGKEEKEEKNKEGGDKKDDKQTNDLQNDEERKLLENLNLHKFKTVKDALEAYKELESAFGKAQTTIQAYQKGVIPEDMKDGVQGALNVVSRPRVKFEAPDPQDYLNNDGTFDVKSYMDETLAGYTVSLQKSLVFGELATALYTVLSQAITDKHSKLASQIEQDRHAERIAEEVNKLFPELKTDMDVAEIFSGLVLSRYNQKKEPLTKDDFIELAKRATSYKKAPAPQKELKQTEIGGFSGQMSASEKSFEAPKNEQEKAVDEIFERAMSKENDTLF